MMMTWGIDHDRLATVMVERGVAVKIMQLLRDRIRRITWLDGNDPAHFEEIWRSSRICFQLCRQIAETSAMCRITSISSEDALVLYALPVGDDLSDFLDALNKVREKVRDAGPCDPVISDAMGKSLVEIMES